MEINTLQPIGTKFDQGDNLAATQQSPTAEPASNNLYEEAEAIIGPVSAAQPRGDSADDLTVCQEPGTQPKRRLVEKVQDKSAQEPIVDQPLSLSRGTGGVSNTRLEPWDTTFGKMCEFFSQRPQVGGKDGDYFVRGPVREGSHTRIDANIEPASSVVLDADSSFNPQTGEIVQGAPDPHEAHLALKQLDVAHCLFTTHSHDPGGKGNRYRIVILTETHDKGDLTGILEWIFHLLAEKGCYLVNVKENRSWSQPWYLPRLASAESDYLCLLFDAGHPLDVATAMDWYQRAENQLPSPQPGDVAKAAKTRDPGSVFSRFNDQHGNPTWMLEMLLEHGYLLKGPSAVNDAPSYRLLSPHSNSGSAGTILFKGEDNTWKVYSHHNAEDPLTRAGETGSTCDAFDLFRILEHDGNEQTAINAWEKGNDDRPLIQIQGGALSPNLQKAIKALAELDPPRLYQRAHALSRIAHLKEAAETEGCRIPAGTAHIVPLHKSVLTVILSEVIRWEIYKKKAWHLSDPCQKVAGALLDGFGMWGGIPMLLGISEAPILRSDGTLLSVAGFDRSSELYVEGNTPDIQLPDTVSREQAQEAAKSLLEPFGEFPFVEPELDRAVLLALLITLVLRPQLPTAPLTCISATTPGSGKGLLAEVANLLARGRDAATMPPVQGRGGEEEMRKRLTALLIQGITSINMDNWTRAIGGEAMNIVLTTTEWTDRVLGGSVTVTVPARFTMIATGNNLSVRGDTTRRAIAILLDAKVERPELRTFKEKDLPARILRDRGVLLQHLFTILKGYQQAGSPGSNDNPLGRFEAWTARVCGPIRWLGYPDPLDSQQRLRELDPEADRLACLMEAWWGLMDTGWYTAGDIIKAVEDPTNTNKQTKGRESMRTALRDVAAEGRDSISSKLLGWYLGHNEGRIVEDYRLERRPRGDSKSKKAQQYRVINTSLLDDR